MPKFELWFIVLQAVVLLRHVQVATTCVSNVTVDGATTRNVNEGTGIFTVMLKRNGNLSESATIEVSGRDGTAKSPADYTVFPLNVTFGVSMYSSSASFNVTIINDNILENNETFLIDLKPPRDTSLVCNNIASLNVIIQDDDKVTVEFVVTTITVQEDTKKASLEIVKKGTAVIPIQVRLNMVKRDFETADKNVDYTDRNNENITFQANEAKKSVEFEIKDDSKVEGTEVFAVSLVAVNTGTTNIGSKSLAIIRIEDKADQDFQAKTQKQKEEDQETRAKQLLILLIVCTALIAVLIAVFIIFLCFVIKWLMKTKI